MSTRQKWQEFLSSVAARDRIGIVAAQDLLIASLELHRPHGISEGPVTGPLSSSLQSSLSSGYSFHLRCLEEGGQDHLQREVFVQYRPFTSSRPWKVIICKQSCRSRRLSSLQQVQALEIQKQTISALDPPL